MAMDDTNGNLYKKGELVLVVGSGNGNERYSGSFMTVREVRRSGDEGEVYVVENLIGEIAEFSREDLRAAITR